MRRRLLGIAVIGVGLALAVVFASSSHGSRGLDNLSNRGVPVTSVSPAGGRALAHLGATELRLLGQMHGRQFFRFTAHGSECFASGDAEAAGATPTDVFCPHGSFPSASRPVYDDPAVEIAKGEPGVARLLALDGFAADGIARVELVRQDTSIASAPLVGNVFSLDVAGVDIAGTRLVAFDKARNIVFSQPYAAPPG
jgi:hypothetical protein